MTSNKSAVFVFHWICPGYLRVKHCPEVHIGMDINKCWCAGYWGWCHNSARYRRGSWRLLMMGSNNEKLRRELKLTGSLKIIGKSNLGRSMYRNRSSDLAVSAYENDSDYSPLDVRMMWGLPHELPPFFGTRVYLANPTLEGRPVRISSSAVSRPCQTSVHFPHTFRNRTILPSPSDPSHPGGRLYLEFVSPWLRQPLVQATTAIDDCPCEES